MSCQDESRYVVLDTLSCHDGDAAYLVRCTTHRVRTALHSVPAMQHGTHGSSHEEEGWSGWSLPPAFLCLEALVGTSALAVITLSSW